MPRLVSNPPSPWQSQAVEWLEEPPTSALEIYEEEAKSILSKNDSPDIGFRYSINPYRGCFHGCAYCYARPTHQYLGFGAGTDFERRLVVKINAAALLQRELRKRSWKTELIVFSGDTDCYQPLEATYKLTRQLIDVCRSAANPIGIITKSCLIRRDIDLLSQLNQRADVTVYVSIPFHDSTTARKLEPFVPSITKRFETLCALSAAGIETGIALAPIIPGLNDADIPILLETAHAAGARKAFMTLLRLPAEVAPVFSERLAEAFPDRTEKILHAIRETKKGRLNRSSFGQRFSGAGPRWEMIEQLFQLTCRRLGMNRDKPTMVVKKTGPPGIQLDLF